MHPNTLWRAGVVGLILWAPTRLRAQDLSTLVEEALDQQVESLRIEDEPISAALAQLETSTGLRFTILPQTIDRLPFGAQTRISVVLQNTSVRDGLNRVFGGLGMRMRSHEGIVHVESMPVVQRLGRRLTLTDATLLERLAQHPWSQIDRAAVPVQFQLDPVGVPSARLEQALLQTPNRSALTDLETASRALGWTWSIDEGTIAFRTALDDVRRRLEQPVALSYARIPLDELLVDLGRKAGVLVQFEPAALQRVAARERLVDLVQKQTTVRQTLERICGNTGLRYELNDEGIRVLGPAAPPGPPGASPSPGATIGWISVPLGGGGAALLLPVREDQLPPEVARLGQERASELLRRLPELLKPAP